MRRNQFIKTALSSLAFSSIWGCVNSQAREVKVNPNVAGDPEIIVIGAGASGLAAARFLVQKGKKVLVLEARNRIGGRIWTDRSWHNTALDLGASWIHGIEGNPVMKLAQELNLKTLPTDYESSTLYDWDGKAVASSKERQIERQFNTLISKLERMRERWQEDEREDISLKRAIAQQLKTLDLSAEQLIELNYSINSTIEHEYAGDTSQLSFYHWDEGEEVDGGDVLFPNGYDQIITGMSKSLTIKLNQVVEKIIYNSQGVKVQTNQGEFKAKQVIITLPLGVLKQGKIEFSPPLPAPKQTAIQQLGMGILNKVYFQFPNIFWDNDSEWLGYMNQNKGEWSEFLNISYYNQKPILLGFNAGEYGLKIEQLTDRQITQAGMQILRNIYGNQIPNPLDTKITRWGQDPFAGGSYSFLTPGSSSETRKILAEPVGKQLYFAGEATSSDYPATVHGAILAGERAARQAIANA